MDDIKGKKKKLIMTVLKRMIPVHLVQGQLNNNKKNEELFSENFCLVMMHSS